MNGRHRVTRRHSVSRSRAACGAAAACIAASGLATFTLMPPASAAALDPACLKPKTADVMVSQGLPTYSKLVRGKSALVKLFMQVPSCAPTGTKMRITNGELKLTGGTTGALPLSSTPLAEIAPPSTSPIPSAQGDPLFLVSGDRLVPSGTDASTVSFTAVLGYTTTKADGTVLSSPGDTITVTHRPDGSTISATIEKASNPLRVLTVPMGDAGNFLLPNSASSQFTDADRAALTKGMTALSRVLPVADGVSAANGTTGGLRTSLSSGLLNVGAYMTAGQFCGTDANYSAITKELNTARNNWNSANPTAPADRVYGVVSSRISQGGVTGNPSCADGYATIGGTAAWGRVVDATSTRPSITGAIASMELLHTTGSVAESDAARYDGGYHSFNQEADVTKPDRAWNVPDKSWLQFDASSLNYRTSGWDDGTTLLEKPDFDILHCQLTPVAAGATSACPSYGPVGRAGALLSVGSSFFLSGSTDGTSGGTDAHTHIDDDVNYERPDPSSTFRFVQRDATGAIVANDGFRVTYDHSHHDGVPGPGRHAIGSFGTELPADSRTDRLELWKGNPATSASAVLLHARDEDGAPQFLAASVQGRTVTVTVQDELPENLRLDVFHVCPGAVSPIVNAAKPLVAAGRSAAFTVPADTSLGCADGTLRYRVSDGYLVAEQDDLVGEAVGTATATAAIYAPVFDTSLTTRKVIGLAGDGRDALGQPADAFDWTLQGPSFPTATKIASGASTAYVPPAVGLQPGTYTLALQAKRDGTVLATATKTLLVLQDTDGDGIADKDESLPCYALGSLTSQANAVLDSDFDGMANVNDPAPCTSSNTATAQFVSTSFNTGSQGNTVMIKLTNAAVDLTRISASQVAITQVAGHRLERPIPAITWTPESASVAKVTFDRQLLSAFMTSMAISGPTPVFLTAPSAGLRAGDAHAPTSF